MGSATRAVGLGPRNGCQGKGNGVVTRGMGVSEEEMVSVRGKQGMFRSEHGLPCARAAAAEQAAWGGR